VVSAHFWPLAMTAILGYLVNSAVRTLLFGYFGRKIYRPGFHFSLSSVSSNLRFGAWLTADSIINYVNTNLSTLVLARILGASVAGGYNLAYNVAVVPPMKLNPIITRVLFPAFAKIQDDTEKLRINFYKLLSVVGIINFPTLLGLMVVPEIWCRWCSVKSGSALCRSCSCCAWWGCCARLVTRLVPC